MNTRTIAIAALVIAVILLLFFLLTHPGQAGAVTAPPAPSLPVRLVPGRSSEVETSLVEEGPGAVSKPARVRPLGFETVAAQPPQPAPAGARPA